MGGGIGTLCAGLMALLDQAPGGIWKRLLRTNPREAHGWALGSCTSLVQAPYQWHWGPGCWQVTGRTSDLQLPTSSSRQPVCSQIITHHWPCSGPGHPAPL